MRHALLLPEGNRDLVDPEGYLLPQVTTQNLERVRRIKNRMVRLTTKVETIREVLEKFLDDDSDMKDMNLTARVSNGRQTHRLARHKMRMASDMPTNDTVYMSSCNCVARAAAKDDLPVPGGPYRT